MLAATARPLSGYLSWVTRCNDGAAVKPSLVPWLVNSTSVIGYLKPEYGLSPDPPCSHPAGSMTYRNGSCRCPCRVERAMSMPY